MIGIGLSGWMADFGEYLPTDAILYNGADAQQYHNRYPVEWAKVNREAVEEAGKIGDVAFSCVQVDWVARNTQRCSGMEINSSIGPKMMDYLL